MISVAQMMSNKDSENKKFIAFMTAGIGGTIAALALAGAAIFGVKPKIEGKKKEKDNS